MSDTRIQRFADPRPSQHQIDAPWADAVEIPAGARLLFLAGQTPPVVDPAQPDESFAAYGDTCTQTLGCLRRIEAALEQRGYGIGDIVKMTAYMVRDSAKGDVLDLAGFGKAYRQFFGTGQQPNLPARTRVEVKHFMNRGWLVEIDVIAAKLD